MPDIRPAALGRGVKKILTVHDLSFHHFPKFFSAKSRLWYRILKPKKQIMTSDSIIAVSAFTKNDLVKTYRVPEEKITVTHEGVDEDFCLHISEQMIAHVRSKYRLPEKYFLFLSTIEPRKNIANLVKAFIAFKLQNNADNTVLVIAGARNPKIFSEVNHAEHHDIRFTGFIDEKDKAAVIKGARAFLYPSLFEGFGLPLVEAMQCGTPLITSNTSSIPEVIGDAGLLINPQYPEEIAAAMVKILTSEVRSDLHNKMAQQIKKFSWKKCAAETLKIFESCAK